MENKIIEMYKDNKSYTEIQKELKIGHKRIIKLLNDNNLPTQRWLGSWDVDNAIELFTSGVSVSEIGKRFGVATASISAKLKRLGYSIINPKSIAKFDETIFDKIDTEEKAYWLGFIFADGYISLPFKKDGRKSYDFEISLASKDYDHLKKFNDFMKFQGQNAKMYGHRCRWIIGNKHLWEKLNSYGCVPRKSLVLDFPNINIFENKSLIIPFIRGYFDGDGSISTKETSKSTLSISLVGTNSFLSEVLNQTNTILSLRPLNKENINTFCFSTTIYKAKLFLDTIYNNATIYLGRKYNLWKTYCRSLEGSNELQLREYRGKLRCQSRDKLTNSERS